MRWRCGRCRATEGWGLHQSRGHPTTMFTSSMGCEQPTVASEGDLDVLSHLCTDRPKLALRASLDASDDVRRNHLDGFVEVRGSSVVKLPAVGDLVFKTNKLVLETQEVLVGFQVGVLFGDHVDARNHARQQAFSSGDAL